MIKMDLKGGGLYPFIEVYRETPVIFVLLNIREEVE